VTDAERTIAELTGALAAERTADAEAEAAGEATRAAGADR